MKVRESVTTRPEPINANGSCSAERKQYLVRTYLQEGMSNTRINTYVVHSKDCFSFLISEKKLLWGLEHLHIECM
jgi:hypothetical protein